MIFVDTPNIEAVGHRLYGRDWRGLEPPRHLVIFNQVSFMRALAEAGFDNIRLHPRTDALAFTAAQSRRIAGGLILMLMWNRTIPCLGLDGQISFEPYWDPIRNS